MLMTPGQVGGSPWSSTASGRAICTLVWGTGEPTAVALSPVRGNEDLYDTPVIRRWRPDGCSMTAMVPFKPGCCCGVAPRALLSPMVLSVLMPEINWVSGLQTAVTMPVRSST
jgi:hypothetical protein